jgi:ATP-binding cassette, subfamily B, bacterial MsbA
MADPVKPTAAPTPPTAEPPVPPAQRKVRVSLLAWFWGGQADWDRLKRLFWLILEHRGLIVVALVCMVIYNVLNALPAWYVKDVVDSLQKGRVPDISKFTLVAVGVFLIFLVKGVFYFAHNYWLGLATQLMLHRLRTNLYTHLQTFSFSFFSHRSSGDLISRFTADLLTLQNAVRVVVLGPLRDIPQIFIFLGILLFRSWQLFLFSLVIIPIALALIHRFGSRTKRLTSQRLASFGEMTTVLHETINGIRVVKAFSMEAYERKRFERANNDVLNRYNRTIRITSYSQPVLETIGALAGAGIIMYGGYLIIHHHITPGDFVSFLLAFFMLNDPIKKLNAFSLTVQEGLAAMERVYSLLDLPAQEVDPPGAQDLAPLRESLHIHVERFGYEGSEEPALREIDLEVKAGQVVALVGPSGAGKTSLVNLIPRFFELKEGWIRIDGVDVRQGTLASLRGQIAIVTQEIFLFNDTVANNIAYGNIDCPREQIIAAAQAAFAEGFISALPKGYDTLVGEGGIHLSGGQRQRISIARALIKNAPILVLDEATSALDSESEQEVQKAIAALIQNRTTIVIAHRLSTIRQADLICVMEKGRIRERGGHDELMRSGGLYKKLHDMQFRDQGGVAASGRFPWRRLIGRGRRDEPKSAGGPR